MDDLSTWIYKKRVPITAQGSIAGTIAVTGSSNTVVGTDTLFTQWSVGSMILLPNSIWYSISAITDDTHLTISESYPGSDATAQAYDMRLINYQMKLLVGESSGATGEAVDCGGLCLSNFNDIRFTKADEVTLLDYWIESISGVSPNQLATIIIEIDSIGTATDYLCMFYGNSAAPAVSSGVNTFPFFDDFSGNLNKWNSLVGTWSIESGKLKGLCGSSQEALLISTDPIELGDDYAVEVDIEAQYGLTGSNFQSGPIINDSEDDQSRFDAYWLDASGYDKWVLKDPTTAATLSAADASFDARTRTKYSFRKNRASHILFINGIQKVTASYAWGTPPRYVGCKVGYEPNYAYFINFRVRKYVANEPTWGTWGDQEANSAAPACYLHARRDRMNMRGVSTQNMFS